MDEKILSIFRERNEDVSGEELSRLLGVSRSAIWKHIEKLRAEGYDIVAHPHRGYRLLRIPDKLLPAEIAFGLNTKIMGKKIYSYQRIDSTMDIAYRLAENNSPEGVVVFSEEQSFGRGRMGRKWISPKGKGVYLSLVLRPKIPPLQAAGITLLIAVGIARAIRKVSGLTVKISWPNDILINNKKVCGILTELNAELDSTKFLILGVGINVNTPKSLLPKEATSIKEELGCEISRVELAKEVLREVEKYYILFKQKKFSSIVKEWKDLSLTIGSRIKVFSQGRKIEGQAQDIDSHGALVVRLDNGFLEHLWAGDVTRVKVKE